MKNNNKPDIRFPGFSVNWKSSELSNFLSHLKSGLSRMLSNQDIGLPVIRANNINNGNLDLENDIKYWYTDDPQGANTQNYLIHKNDILVNFINSEAKMGTSAIVRSEPKRPTIYTTNILNLRTKQDANPYFIYTLTMTEKYKSYIKLITKPAVNQASFTTVDFKKYKFLAPIIEEQTEIGNFFKQLDNAIALHQQELTTLKQTKQGFLQKMFPKEGESVPEFRFPGFTGEWEQLMFSNIVNRVSKQSNDNNLPKIEFEDIVSGEGRLNKDVSQKFDNRKGIVFEPNFILFGKLRPYLKNWLYPNFKGIALGDFWVFEPNNSSSIFIYYLIQTDKYQEVANLSTGTKMPRSDWKTVSETEFRVPTIEEQTKIGSFFKQLDDVISLHQSELDALKETKKAFLQKMFA